MSGCLGKQCPSSGYVEKCTQLRCLQISISVVRCPFAFLVNFTYPSGEKYVQVKVIKWPNSSPHGDVSGLRKYFQALGYGALIHLFVFLPPYPPPFSSYFISVTGALCSPLLCGGLMAQDLSAIGSVSHLGAGYPLLLKLWDILRHPTSILELIC